MGLIELFLYSPPPILARVRFRTYLLRTDEGFEIIRRLIHQQKVSSTSGRHCVRLIQKPGSVTTLFINDVSLISALLATHQIDVHFMAIYRASRTYNDYESMSWEAKYMIAKVCMRDIYLELLQLKSTPATRNNFFSKIKKAISSCMKLLIMP